MHNVGRNNLHSQKRIALINTDKSFGRQKKDVKSWGHRQVHFYWPETPCPFLNPSTDGKRFNWFYIYSWLMGLFSQRVLHVFVSAKHETLPRNKKLFFKGNRFAEWKNNKKESERYSRRSAATSSLFLPCIEPAIPAPDLLNHFQKTHKPFVFQMHVCMINAA